MMPGSATPRPKASRDSGSWPVPVRLPQVPRYAAGTAPTIVPSTMAARAVQKSSPSETPTVPENTPVMVRLGANHTVKRRAGFP